jgi:hypothetical protein
MGREEEDLELTVGDQRFDELGKLLPNYVENPPLVSDLEQCLGVDLGDLWH